jgi:FecR protein
MKDPRLPVEVDPWNDGRWSRVERELFQKLDDGDPGAEKKRARRVRRRTLAWGGLAAAAVLALMFFLRPAALRSNDRLRVATSESPSEVTFGESALTVAPRSLVLVSGDDEHGVDVVLDRGAVTCQVAPRNGRPPFVVDAGAVRVRVVGTKFTVARADDATTVAVDHGVVEVTAQGVVTVLHDGERWPSPPASIPSPSSSVPVGSASDPSPGTDTPRAPSAVPSSHVRSAAGTLPSPASPSLAADSTAGLAPSAASMPAPSTASAPSPQEDFETAARLERTSPDQAAAIYRRLASGSTAWSPGALFALARLEADRGHHAEATRLLDEYLTRYPRGINADDARSLLQRMR